MVEVVYSEQRKIFRNVNLTGNTAVQSDIIMARIYRPSHKKKEEKVHPL